MPDIKYETYLQKIVGKRVHSGFANLHLFGTYGTPGKSRQRVKFNMSLILYLMMSMMALFISVESMCQESAVDYAMWRTETEREALKI